MVACSRGRYTKTHDNPTLLLCGVVQQAVPPGATLRSLLCRISENGQSCLCQAAIARFHFEGGKLGLECVWCDRIGGQEWVVTCFLVRLAAQIIVAAHACGIAALLPSSRA